MTTILKFGHQMPSTDRGVGSVSDFRLLLSTAGK